jgi:hypothetical protein
MDLTKAKLWFVALSMISLILFGISVQKESDREWKKWQKEFFAMEQERGVDRDYTVKIRQIWLPSMNRTDRCITCHLGMEDTDVVNPYTKNPFKSHPNVAMLKQHPVDKLGCTICHEGQGLATTTKGAHGHVHAWDYPMHETIGGIAMIQSSCTKCHAHDALPEGTEGLVAARAIMKKNGCLGCHTADQLLMPGSLGGTQCPNLTDIGSKTESEFANTHIFAEVEDRLKDGHFTTKYEWLFQHFLNPQKVTPGTAMPNFHLNETEANLLTALVMSLKDPARENIPSQWLAKGKGKYTVKLKE